MKATKYGRHLIMITQYHSINCFLVIEEDGLTLVDTLMRGAGPAILDVIAETDLPLRRIVLTHAHSDHAGSVDELLSSNPEVEFLVVERAIPILKADLSLLAGEPPGKIVRAAYREVKAELTGVIKEGDQVGSLQVIATPGHAVEHHAYYDSREGILIAGDCWQTLGGLAVAGDTRWLFPFPSFGTWNKLANLESARKTLEFCPKTLAVGHGRLMENATDPMSAAADRAAQKMTKCRNRSVESTAPQKRR